MTRRRAVSIKELFQTSLRTLEFSGDWKASIGDPEASGAWIIWGNPANGKTRFALQLAKYLATLGLKVAYNSLEEGVSTSLRKAIHDTNIIEVSRRFVLLDKEPVAELNERLRRRKSPDVVIIDSVQYSGMSYAAYKELKEMHRTKLFILVSHAEGSHPSGRVARSIRYDASVKVYVQGFQAFPASRYGGGKPYVIWPEGAFEISNPKTNE